MNADHDYQIGKDHTVCQDYALSGVVDNFAYALVCDGCSSSPDVDFGARVLAMSARETLRRIKKSPMSHEAFGSLTIRKADLLSSIFPWLNPEFLDSTLLVAWITDKKMTAYLYGDGVLFHKSATTLRAVHVDYKVTLNGVEKPAPAYLSYLLDSNRSDSYEKAGGTKTVYDGTITTTKEGTSSTGEEKVYKTTDPLIIEATVEPGDIIAVCSDGINSFRRPDNTAIGWRELINDYTGFKTTQGVFTQRRIAAFKRKCQKELITHSDDISLAAIVV